MYCIARWHRLMYKNRRDHHDIKYQRRNIVFINPTIQWHRSKQALRPQRTSRPTTCELLACFVPHPSSDSMPRLVPEGQSTRNARRPRSRLVLSPRNLNSNRRRSTFHDPSLPSPAAPLSQGAAHEGLLGKASIESSARGRTRDCSFPPNPCSWPPLPSS